MISGSDKIGSYSPPCVDRSTTAPPATPCSRWFSAEYSRRRAACAFTSPLTNLAAVNDTAESASLALSHSVAAKAAAPWRAACSCSASADCTARMLSAALASEAYAPTRPARASARATCGAIASSSLRAYGAGGSAVSLASVK